MHNRNLRYFLYKIKVRLKRCLKVSGVKIKREIPQCDSSFMTTSKKFSESGKLMSITLEPLHRFVCGFRRLKVRFIFDSDIPIWNVNNVGNESKIPKIKLSCNEIWPIKSAYIRVICPHPEESGLAATFFSSSQLSAKTGQYKQKSIFLLLNTAANVIFGL